MTALEKGLHGQSLLRFYHLARACLVKSEAFFDAYDRVFAKVFHGVEGSLDVTEELLEWLRDPKNKAELTPEQRELLERLSRDELMRRFLETLAKQDERHDGGGRWIGTGGHSPFGHGGEHPSGIRVGGPGQQPLGDEGLGGAPLPRLPHRRDARPAPVEGRAAAPPAPDARRRGRRSSTSTRRSTRPAATPARSSWCSARRGATTCGCCC